MPLHAAVSASASAVSYPLFVTYPCLHSPPNHLPMLLPTRSKTGKRQWPSVGTLAATMACFEVIVAIAVAPNPPQPISTSRLKSHSSWLAPNPTAKQDHERRQFAPWSLGTLSPAPTQTNLPTNTAANAAAISSTAQTTLCSYTKTQPYMPPLPTQLPRPPTKPRLLTDFEYDTMWDPDMNTLRLGVLLNLDAGPREREAVMVRKALSVIRLAVNNVNENQIIPGLNMSIIVRDSQNPSLYSPSGGLAAINGAGQLIGAKVSGVIGDIRSDLTRYEALMTSSVQISQCSFASVNTVLSDSRTYPYFFRTIPTTIILLDAMLDVIRSMGWKRISLIYDIETLGWSGREYFSARAAKLGIYVLAYQPLSTAGVPFDPTYKFVRDQIQSTQSRVQVLIAAGDIQNELLQQMRQFGLFSSDYAWVTLNDISSPLRQEPDVKDFDGLIMIDNGWEMNGYDPYENFLEQWLTLNPEEYPGAGDPTVDNNEGMAYSCVMMLAHAYADLINGAVPDPSQIPNSPLIQELLAGDHTEDVHVSETYRSKPYRGPSGPITLDDNGDRKEGYYVALSLRDGKAVHFGFVFSGEYTFIRKPFFKESHPDLPSDAPPWAIQNPQWNRVSGIIYGILCCLGIVATLITAALVIYFRDHIIIKASSPTFCICELFGILLVFIWCTLHIGIPNRAICIAQTFILPIGVTLLVGSLTVKNYRIYRIFNSVTVSNQAFQTRLLVRYVAVAVLLCVIPMVVEMAVDAPAPYMINIRAFQWVRCRGIHTQTWWVISSSIIPALLVLFGVFLAIKTRNVVFLWNEARQISLVLYNVLFFAIIIVVSQAFPMDLYLATFYISIVGTLFIDALSLIVLFPPKFWGIWKSMHKTWGEDGHPNPQNQGGLGGGGGGGFGGAAVMGRMPGDIKVSGRAAIAPAVAALDLETAGGDRNPTTSEKFLEPVFNSRRKRSTNASISTSNTGISKIEGNPLGAWMNSRIPRKGSAPMTGTFLPGSFSSESLSLDDGIDPGFGRKKKNGVSSTADQDFSGEDNQEHQIERLGRNELKATDDGAAGDEEEPKEPLNTALQMNRTFGSSSSGAHRMLDAYVFLLPIRVQKSRIASLLSHWSMATLILMPEAHAFLSVDSTDGKSASYLMLSMYQLQKEPDPTITVTTCHAGTLLIRFSSQHRLDSWMNLFSEEDRQALSARSASTSSTNSNPPFASGYSSGGGGPGGGAAVRRRSTNLDGVPDSMSQPISNMHFSGISPEMSDMGIPGLRGPPYPDPPMAALAPSSWTSRLSASNSLSRLWSRKDSAKSISGASSQSVYTANNTFNLNYNQFPPSLQDPSQFGAGGELHEDLSNGAARWARAGGEWTSTDSDASNSIPAGRQSNANRRENSNSYVHRKSFLGMGAGETVIEDKDGEQESSFAKNNPDIADTQDAVPVADLDARGSSVLAAVLPSVSLADNSVDDISISKPSQGEDALKDEQISSIAPSQESQEIGVGLNALDVVNATKSLQSETTSSGSVLSYQTHDKLAPIDLARPDPPSNRNSRITVDIDDDDDDDDLYDPEFGIGGGQRRRRRRIKPSRMNTGIAAIPSAAVISAAAAAVSAGWSEGEALAAAIANSPALPQVSSNARLGGNRSRKESVGEGYLSSSSASSMYSNHAGDSSGSGTRHVATRIYTDRVNMSPAGGSLAKRMSAGASSILLSPAPSTPQSSLATTPTASPLAPYPRRTG